MNQELLKKVNKTDFAKLFRQKGYSYFADGYYNLNIIGIRAAGNAKRGQSVAENMKRGQPAVSRPVTNQFDDIFVVEYNTPARLKVREVFAGTTEPGRYYMRNPSNAKGTAILVPGQWRGMWRVVNDFMGGPFVSYTFADNRTGNLVTVEGYYYEPNQKKRNQLLQLEAIAYSLQFTEE